VVMRLGPCGLAYVHGAAAAALHRRRHALLRGHRSAQRLPAVVDALGLEPQAQGCSLEERLQLFLQLAAHRGRMDTDDPNTTHNWHEVNLPLHSNCRYEASRNYIESNGTSFGLSLIANAPKPLLARGGVADLDRKNGWLRSLQTIFSKASQHGS